MRTQWTVIFPALTTSQFIAADFQFQTFTFPILVHPSTTYRRRKLTDADALLRHVIWSCICTPYLKKVAHYI